MVLFTPKSRLKITLLILTGTTINLFTASKEKVCLFPATSVEGPAKYGTVDSKQRCYEQPRVDCFLPK